MEEKSTGQSKSPQGINLSMGLVEWFLLCTLSVLWGGSFFFVEVAVQELPPLSIVVLRVGLAALTLWGVLILSGIHINLTRKLCGTFLVMGLLNNAIPFYLLVWGQTQIASGLASILNATTPVFTVIVAGVLLADERITPLKLLGVLTGLGGVVLIFGTEALSVMVESGNPIWGQLACVGAAISYAFAGVFGRRFKEMGVTPMVTAAGQVTASTMLLAPVAFIMDKPWDLPIPSMWTWLSISGLAVVSTALAYIIYFRLLGTAGATNLLLVTLLVPITAILLGALILGEQLQPKHYIGLSVIGLGLSAIDGRLWRGMKAIITSPMGKKHPIQAPSEVANQD